MKKSVIKNLVAVLSNEASEMTTAELLAELNAELAQRDKANADRSAKKNDARAEVVAKMRPIVLGLLTAEPHTSKELYAMSTWEEGFTEAKLQYLLSHDLKEEVKTIDNGRKANTYAAL